VHFSLVELQLVRAMLI